MKKKILTVLIAAISAMCCAFAFTACDKNDGEDGELVIPGNSFVCTEVVVEYTEDYYSLSDSEKEDVNSCLPEEKEICELGYINSIYTFNTNGTTVLTNYKDQLGTLQTKPFTGYYKIENDRISFMNASDISKDISEVSWYENYYGIIKDGKLRIDPSVGEYYHLINVYEKV